MRTPTSSRFVPLALALALLSCGSSPKEPAKSDLGRARRPVKPSQPAHPKPDDRVPPSVPSHLLVNVPDKTVGPFIAYRGAARMAAYIATTEAGVRRVVSVPIGPDGEPREARVVASSAPDATTLVVRAPGGDRPGFVIAWTALSDRGEVLFLAGVGDDGVPTSTPFEVARTGDDIVWVEIVPTPRGAVCVWAEETRGGDANVLAAGIDPDGKLRGVPSRVARGVTGWQAVPTTAGAGLALIARAPSAAKKDATTAPRAPSTLSWLKLDADARPVAPALVLASSPSKVDDVDVARIGDAFVFAWTERAGLDPEVRLAWVDAEGKPQPARPATERSGGATLVALEGGAKRGLFAWEEATRRARGTRRLHLVRLGAGGVPDPTASAVLEVEGAGTPEIVAMDAGYAVLSRARACAKEGADPLEPPCEMAPPLPVFLRLDDDLHVTLADPIRLGDTHEPAAVAWGLGCRGDACLALAATGESPVTVRAVDLASRTARYLPPIAAVPPGDTARVLQVATLAAGDAFAELAVAPLAGGALVATVTSGIDEPTRSGGGATLTVHALGADGAPRAPAAVVTTRALSVGGVGIAPAPAGTEGAAVAWVARDDGDPEVHVTRVDNSGRRTRDVRLTMTKGDASDVAIAAAPGGWVVAWVDTRDGNGEVYASKVDTELRRVARDERITNAPGDASDVTVLGARGAGPVWLAWADPRESPHDGFADIFVAGLAVDTVKTSAREARVLATAAHSRSPVLASRGGDGGGVSLAWIEEAPMGIDPASTGVYGAMFAELDAQGRLEREPLRTRGAGDGFPTAVTIDRAASSAGPLRGALARSTRDELVIDALDFAASTPRAVVLFSLEGPPSLDVSLALQGSSLFWNDDGPNAGDGRMRRASLEFPR